MLLVWIDPQRLFWFYRILTRKCGRQPWWYGKGQSDWKDSCGWRRICSSELVASRSWRWQQEIWGRNHRTKRSTYDNFFLIFAYMSFDFVPKISFFTVLNRWVQNKEIDARSTSLNYVYYDFRSSAQINSIFTSFKQWYLRSWVLSHKMTIVHLISFLNLFAWS